MQASLTGEAVVPNGQRLSSCVHRIDPLRDARWDRFLTGHPSASVFHSRAWLNALHLTYGYEPIVLATATPDGSFRSAMVFCRVETLLTGRRLVSLPFSDHCEPLLGTADDARLFHNATQQESRTEDCRYVEIRPLHSTEIAAPPCRVVSEYAFHQLDLQPDLETLFSKFHKDSVQRKIRRAEKEKLTVQEGDETLLEAFFNLLVLTRRRHGLPPQPRTWFRNLSRCFRDALKIRIALKRKHPVAGMLTIRFKRSLVCKYAGSDAAFHSLGGTHLLYWRAIQDAKQLGLRVLDFGRSDKDQMGLIKFKRRWGAVESKLMYFRYSSSGNFGHIFDPGTGWKMRIARQGFAHAPASLLPALGQLLYRHIG